MNSETEFAASLEELQIELCRPGRLLVFIDDSGTPEQRLGKDLVRDFKLHAAAIVRSEDYRLFLRDHRALLSHYDGMKEFHTVDIVNEKHFWEGRDPATRRLVLETFGRHFTSAVQLVPYVHIGIEQYNECLEKIREMGARPSPPEVRWELQSEGARFVLLKTLIPLIWKTFGNHPLVIVEDGEGALNKHCEHMFSSEADVFGDGVFRVKSEDVPGVQLADLAAYTWNRMHRIKAYLNQQRFKPGTFDEALLDFFGENKHKFRSILDEPLSEPEAAE
ncbi:MAG: DUF3800 domain-containing protein [Polyangiaceae bacterium]|nr:DUF3800 domain-containing protein [Polyangiaceae bacterium]